MNKEEIKTFLAKLPFSKGVEIAKIDESGLVALNKKAGVMSHPNPKKSTKKKNPNDLKNAKKNDKKEKKEKTLLYCSYNFDKEYYSFKTEEGERLRLYLVNRLDSHTSGLILVATNEEVANAAKLAFKNHEVEKEYLAVCFGRPSDSRGTFRDFIKTENKSNKFVRSDIVEGLYKNFNAEAKYTLIRQDKNNLNVSLLSLKPTTGKTHQLRIQCANKDIPIVGDATYGNFARNKTIKQKTKLSRLFLHCKRVSMNIQLVDKNINFEASTDIPQSFSTLLDKNIKTMSSGAY